MLRQVQVTPYQLQFLEQIYLLYAHYTSGVGRRVARRVGRGVGAGVGARVGYGVGAGAPSHLSTRRSLQASF